MGDYLAEVQLPTGFIIDDLHLGQLTTYVMSTEGVIIPFGMNTHGQCGLGHANHVGDEAGEMGDSLEAIDLGSDFYPAQLSGGSYTGCAINIPNLFFVLIESFCH